jgi:hypothetical protein
MPSDWHLNDGNMQLFCQQQQFNVENPRWEMLPWEYLLCGCASEKLESALGISDVTDTNYPQNGV